jgi:predicted acyltransferase
MAKDLGTAPSPRYQNIAAEPTLRELASKSVPPVTQKKDFIQQRLYSLDAYRGLIMITLAFAGFGLAATAINHLRVEPESPFWQEVYHQFEHAAWVGCGYWDLIQPSFMFMVGAAMAFSYAKRQQQGHSYLRMFGHAVWRSLFLVFLGVFLISNGRRWNGRPSIDWSLMNVLSQIGLGYTFLFLLWGRRWWIQGLAALTILVATWLAYTLYPHAGIDLAHGAPEVGVSQAWAQKHLANVPPAWHKNANVGHALDLWLLNVDTELLRQLLNKPPLHEPFRFNEGGYQTLNFLPSLATMIFGLMCGELLRGRLAAGWKLLILLAAGSAGLAIGWTLDWAGICPLVKRLWTPSWALFSTGWCCLILALLYAIIDVGRLRGWAFPLVVVGVNSIAIYCMSMTLKPWVRDNLGKYLGSGVFTAWGLIDPLFEPLVSCTLVGLVFWLVCWWMYRHKVFIRI